MLTFDEPTHIYRWHGAVVPSVTQCLDRLHSFAGVPYEVLESARERGTYVHEMCEAYDLGDLDEERVPDGFTGYLEAWKRFIATYQPNWAGIEQRRYSERYGFAGTEDRHGTFERALPGRWGIDIKTGVLHPVMGLQLAAYRQLRAEEDYVASLDRRATVHLKHDGTFTFMPWEDPADWPTFAALLQLIAWSKRCPN